MIADLHPGADRAKVEAIIQEEINDLVHNPVSGQSLDRVKLATEAGFVWSLERLGSRANRLQSFNHYLGDPGFSSKHLEKVRAVNPASVREAAKTWLAAPRVELVSVPKAKEDGGRRHGGGKRG